MKRDIACRRHRPEDLCETLGTSMHQHFRLFWITSLTVYPRALSTKPQVSICTNLPCQLHLPWFLSMQANYPGSCQGGHKPLVVKSQALWVRVQ